MKKKQLRTLSVMRKSRQALYDPPSRVGHRGIVGKSGYGKGTLGQTLCEQEFEKGNKVLIWDMFRAENTFYSFKEENPEMLELNWAVGRSSKKFKSEVLVPIFAKRGATDSQYFLPSSWIPVKINFDDLTEAEILYLMGATTPKAEQILKSINFSSFGSLTKMQVKFLELESGADKLFLVSDDGAMADIGDKRIYRTINRALASLVQKNIVASKIEKGFEFVDIDRIQGTPDVMTCVTGRGCGSMENFLTFFFNVMNRLILDRQKHSGKYAPMVIYIPEVSNIAGATSKDDSVVSLMRFILQEARDSGISIILDTQRPKNIDSSVKAQITTWYVFNLNKDDVDYMDKNLVEIPRDYNIFWEILNQGRGVCVKLWQDSGFRWRYRKAAHIFPPRSHKKSAYEDINAFYVEQGIKTNKVVDKMVSSVRTVFGSEVMEEDAPVKPKDKDRDLQSELFG